MEIYKERSIIQLNVQMYSVMFQLYSHRKLEIDDQEEQDMGAG